MLDAEGGSRAPSGGATAQEVVQTLRSTTSRGRKPLMGIIRKERRIGIIGAGFTGTLLAVHLMRLAKVPTDLFLVERRGNFGRGLAYSTGNEAHLLNVRVANMSAWPDDP